MSQVESESNLKIRPRPSTTLTITVPLDVVDDLAQAAQYRDMSIEGLLKLYIGQGLRQDVAKLFSERVLDLTAKVLTRHGQSQEQIEAILREIRGAGGV